MHRACLAATAAALVFIAACPAIARDTGPGPVERAEIVPLTNQFLGPAVNGSAGFSLYANGISDYWTTATSATVNIVIFVFPGRQVTQDIAFSMIPPDGGKPVYAYTFPRQSIGPIGTWFSLGATGDYSKAGTYEAVVTADGQEIGRIPIVFTAPTVQ